MNTDIRTSAVILTALIRLRPDDPILPKAVRGLMAARQFGDWSNTQETAWSIIALTDWLTVTHELEGNYRWQVTLTIVSQKSFVPHPSVQGWDKTFLDIYTCPC